MATYGAEAWAKQAGGEIDLTQMLDLVFIMFILCTVTAVFI